ncbi:MAG: response regulator [Thermoanaerobaculales bacterium]|jgi:CheY-like chemotaxis protein|nr:response regulator [Thermoanaerobaculales bacterium]
MTRPEDKTVLIVDDEPDVVIYFSGILERAGFNVVTAFNGQEALEAVREHQPDFISLDLVMPEKSGIRFLYELRKNREWAKIPIMIVTAHARDDLGKDDFEEIFSGRTMTGPLTYLEKPVKPEGFLHNVMKILGLAPLEEEPVPAEKDRLRGRITSRLEDADLNTLERVIEALRLEPDES